MQTPPDAYYQQVLQARQQGLGYEHIRQQLLAQGLAEPEISALLRQTNQFELQQVANQANRAKLREQMLIGLGIVLAGGVLAAYTHWRGMLSGSMWWAVWGLMLGGYLWFRRAWRRHWWLRHRGPSNE